MMFTFRIAMKCEQEPSFLTGSIFYHMHFMIVAFCNLDFKWFNLQIPYRFLKLGGNGSDHLQTTILGTLNSTCYKHLLSLN